MLSLHIFRIQELAHRCAVYESDNKSLKEKVSICAYTCRSPISTSLYQVHDAQARLGDLEAELHKLKPLLVIQPTPAPHAQRQEPMHSPMLHPYNRLQGYMTQSSLVTPSTSAVPHVAFSPYSTSSSHDVHQKRKRDDMSSSKGKEKETTEDISDTNADDDSDNTDAPLTPTPTSSVSHNPYAYMNNLYRHVLSPSNTMAVLPATPLKPPGIQNSASVGANSHSPSAISLNHYAIAYPSYPFSTTTLSKQPSTFTVAGSRSNRQEDPDKDGSQVDEIHNAKPEKPKSTSAPSRRAMATSGRKYKTSSVLSDARAEHLLLAARKIGRGRAVTIAGLVKAQERSATEEHGKDKAKTKDITRHSETSHSSVFATRSTQRRRVAGINSPTTPTPRRVHGHTQPLTEVPSLAMTPNAGRTRETLLSLGKTPRHRSSIADINASGLNASKDDEGITGSGQTPLDSLLSAARTMMSKDRESGPTAAGQSITSNVGAGANQDVAEHQLLAEESQGDLEGAHPRKRRRNTISRGTVTATPKSQTAERQGTTSHVWQVGPSAPSKRASAKDNVLTPSGRRTRSALDVLADQAAAAFEGGSATHQDVDQTENCDGSGPSTSESCTSPLVVDSHDPVKMSSTHELVPHAEEAINAAAVPGQMEVFTETAGKGSSGTESGTNERHAIDLPSQQPGSSSQDTVVDKAALKDRAVIPAESLTVSIAESKSSSSNSEPNNGRSEWDPFGGMPNVATIDSGGDSEGDMDAEGDIDPDSQETSLDGDHIIHLYAFVLAHSVP